MSLHVLEVRKEWRGRKCLNSQRYTNTKWLQISLPHPQKRIPYVMDRC